ncbi:hypothetical protein CBR_g11924 [Chara braunii]|uniref:1-deoxy-D-xylulose-5-phosphate reductoisomerase n=1 Tax=Chara braunii TaxID=69332 RepID=A0A388KQN2_CHABU|nr:hypothetical protein CBR_g11924 [Chara braunii]|eukprot:GBG72346.1 hypothetical protein CBR_g11924 [Chara braunii]
MSDVEDTGEDDRRTLRSARGPVSHVSLGSEGDKELFQRERERRARAAEASRAFASEASAIAAMATTSMSTSAQQTSQAGSSGTAGSTVVQTVSQSTGLMASQPAVLSPEDVAIQQAALQEAQLQQALGKIKREKEMMIRRRARMEKRGTDIEELETMDLTHMDEDVMVVRRALLGVIEMQEHQTTLLQDIQQSLAVLAGRAQATPSPAGPGAWTGDIAFSSSSVHGCRVASRQASSDEGRCQQKSHVPRSTAPRAVLHVEKVEISAAAAAVPTTAAPPPAWPGFVEVPADKKKWKGQKPIALIGSTGSIGTQTLDIVNEFSDYFRVVALAAGSNITLLAEQIRQFQPSLVSVSRSELIPELREAIADVENKPEIMAGAEGLCAVAAHPEAVTVVTGIVGCAGLPPTVAAIKAGKDIALANKETLIAGGPAILPLAHEHGVKILPADSEHSAIFQCLQGLPENGLRRIILTASGGAFRDWPVEKLKTVTVADALKHPNWSMGKKITIDSASLMNKGLEVIEAHYLFGADYDNIDVVIHPQSIIHSMVETQDSSVLAQLGWPDMRLPIIYTMSWPQRLPTSEETWRRLDFVKMGDLTFREPDRAKYPSLDLAYMAGRAGGTMTGVLSAANEKAVELFIDERISYLEIMKVNEMVCAEHMADLVHRPDIDTIIHFDQWARRHVEEIVNKGRLATAAKL